MKRPTRLAIVGMSFGLLGLGTACGKDGPPPNPTPQPRPFVDDTDPERARVTMTKNPSAPLVVDWKPENRVDLEVRTKRGPALVRFDAESFELLPECEAPGGYAYVGVTPKRELVKIRSRAELHTNLPFGAFSLSGHLERSGGLNADIRMIGQRVLDRPTVNKADLKGKCSEATHFVRALTVGAFRFTSGTATDIGADVKVLGASAGGSSEGEHEILTVDGEFNSCDGADPDANQPPSKCRAIIRIHVVPLDTAAEEKAQRVACGEGLKWNGSACVTQVRLDKEARETKKAAGAPGKDVQTKKVAGFECDPMNPDECLAQCKAGNALSCVSLGAMFEFGFKSVKKDVKTALELYDITCKAGTMKGCSYLGGHHQTNKNYAEAFRWGTKACTGGYHEACTNVAILAFFGRGMKQDRPLAAKLWARACKLRDWNACNNAGVVLFNGLGGVKQNVQLARGLFQRACDSPARAGCVNLGMAYESGLGGPKDPNRALQLYGERCDQGEVFGCVLKGLLMEERDPKPATVRQSLALYERACQVPDSGGCLTTQELRRTFGSTWSMDGTGRRSCEPDADRRALACFNAAIVHERGTAGRTDLGKARTLLQNACKGGVKRACRRAAPPNRQARRPLDLRAKAAHAVRLAMRQDFSRFAQELMPTHSLFVRLIREYENSKDPEGDWKRFNDRIRSRFERLANAKNARVRTERITDLKPLDDIRGYRVVVAIDTKDEKTGKTRTERRTVRMFQYRGRLYVLAID